jgi:outer membrane murein-binding lipoprotein Lpp
MRISFYSVVFIATVLVAGCAHHQTVEPVFQPLIGKTSTNAVSAAPAAKPAQQPVAPATKPTIQPTLQPTANKPANSDSASSITIVQGLNGKIASANQDLKARVDQRLVVYREGNKVAELNVTGPEKDDSIVADIAAGEVKIGDEVRDK